MTASILLFGNLGGWEVFLILMAILLLFGAKKIPELARGLGKGIREFKDATSNIQDELENSINAKPAPPKAKTPVTHSGDEIAS